MQQIVSHQQPDNTNGNHKEVVLHDGYSTPSQTVRSKISAKRMDKAFLKSENRIKSQVVDRHESLRRSVPESRGTMHRIGQAPYNYNTGMNMHQQ